MTKTVIRMRRAPWRTMTHWIAVVAIHAASRQTPTLGRYSTRSASTKPTGASRLHAGRNGTTVSVAHARITCAASSAVGLLACGMHDDGRLCACVRAGRLWLAAVAAVAAVVEDEASLWALGALSASTCPAPHFLSVLGGQEIALEPSNMSLSGHPISFHQTLWQRKKMWRGGQRHRCRNLRVSPHRV